MAERNDAQSVHIQDKSKVMEKNKNLPNVTRDRRNIALLVFLYVLQGIPLGLVGAMPMLLQTRKVAYKDQATFSLVFWPFSMKLLWAPVVDTAYFSRFGRRKSWLVPVQYLIGIFLLILSVVSFLFNLQNIIFQVVVLKRFHSITPSLGHFLLDIWTPGGNSHMERSRMLVGKFE